MPHLCLNSLISHTSIRLKIDQEVALNIAFNGCTIDVVNEIQVMLEVVGRLRKYR